MLLIHGEADSIVPVHQARQIARAIGPTCQAVILPGVEHVGAYNRAPGRYIAAVDRFFDRNLARLTAEPSKKSSAEIKSGSCESFDASAIMARRSGVRSYARTDHASREARPWRIRVVVNSSVRSLAAAAGAGFAIGGTKSSGRVIGANDTDPDRRRRAQRPGRQPRRRVLEDEGRRDHLPDRPRRPDLRQAPQAAPKATAGAGPKTVKDVREALEDKNLDAISIATPNHWHALMTDLGLPGGQGRLRREAVQPQRPRGAGRRRGRPEVRPDRPARHPEPLDRASGPRSPSWSSRASTASSWSRGRSATSPDGRSRRATSASSPTRTAPAELDFNLWTGPAPEHAFNGNYVHYNWHWFWDFGNGDIGNQGVHQMDIARWMIPARPCRSRSSASAAGSATRTRAQTPNTQVAVFDYGDAQLIFEVRGLKAGAYLGEKVGNIVHLEAGTIAGGKFTPKGSTKAEPLAKVAGLTRGPGKGPLRQLHRRRPEPEDRRPQRRHPRRPLLRRPLPPGQRLLPDGRAGLVRLLDQAPRRGGLRRRRLRPDEGAPRRRERPEPRRRVVPARPEARRSTPRPRRSLTPPRPTSSSPGPTASRSSCPSRSA